MEAFPTKDELQVVAALLLLSHPHPHPHPPPSTSLPLPPPPPPSSDKYFKLWKEFMIHSSSFSSPNKEKMKNRGAISQTTPSNSSLTTDNSIPTHGLHLTSASSSHPLMHLKVARRARSKVIYLSPDQKPAASTRSKPPASVNQKAETSSQITTEGSCLSTGRTREVSSGRKRRSGSSVVEQKNRRRLGPPHKRRSADAIMRLLRGGCASEVRIRQLLGDSPDTSKALRMLLRMDKVKRHGAGGRTDPYIYMVAAAAVDHKASL